MDVVLHQDWTQSVDAMVVRQTHDGEVTEGVGNETYRLGYVRERVKLTLSHRRLDQNVRGAVGQKCFSSRAVVEEEMKTAALLCSGAMHYNFLVSWCCQATAENQIAYLSPVTARADGYVIAR